MSWDRIFSDTAKFRTLAGKTTSVRELAHKLEKLYKFPITEDSLRGAYNRRKTFFKGKDFSELLKKEDYVASELHKREEKNIASELRQKQSALLDELVDARKKVDLLLKASSTPPVKIALDKKYSGTKQRVAVALASDWHVEETVDKRAVNGRNEYNLEIAERRIKAYFENVKGLITHHRKGGMEIDKLVLWLGGDLLTGYIHEELEESNGLSPTQTVLFLLQQLTAYINELSKTIDIQVACNYGNHGRTTKKRRLATGAKNSYEWMLYHLLAQRLDSNAKVSFSIADGDHLYLEIYKYTFRFTHGDNFKFGGGVGGLSVPLIRGVQRIESFRHADYTCLGHFHQLQDFGNVVVNGSLIGYSPYAVSINAPFEPPQQAFFLVDPDHGKCMFTPIWLEE